MTLQLKRIGRLPARLRLASAPGRPGTTPPVGPTLTALLLSSTAATVGQAFSATIAGRTAGSTLSLSGAGAAGLSVSGATVSGTPTAAGPVDLVETLAGAANSPRTTSGAATVSAAAGPAARMIASHIAAPGDGGFGLSDGTATGQNYRSMHFNESGKALTNLSLVYSGWGMSSTNGAELDGPNAVTVRAAIEYPAGTFAPVLFGGVRDVSIGISANIVSDQVAINIPADAQFWVRTFLTVNAGEKWYRGYIPLTNASNNFPGGAAAAGYAAAANLEFIEVGTGLTDKTTGGAITNTAGARGYGPSGIISTDTGLRKPVAAMGDSIIAGGSLMDRRANGTYIGRACSTQRPYMQAAVAGTTAQQQTASGVLARRIDLWKKCGVDTVVTEHGHNDVGGGRSLAAIQADMQTIWNAMASAGFKVIQPTVTPRTTSTDGWKTLANQAIYTVNGGFVGGASSPRSQLNAWIRSLPAPLSDFFDTADAVEPARDDGRWLSAPSTSPRLTTTGANSDAPTADGQHPNITSSGGTTPEYGGVFMLRDACAAKLGAAA